MRRSPTRSCARCWSGWTRWTQPTIDDLFAEMRAEAEAVVRLGAASGALDETRTAFMRYRGQGHEIAVPLPAGRARPAALRDAFETTYTLLFGRIIPRPGDRGRHLDPGACPQPYALPTQPIPHPRGAEPPRLIGHTHAWSTPPRAKPSTPRSIARAALAPGARISGPAAIVEAGTTTIVPTGFTARIAAGGEIIIEEPHA